MNYSNLSIVSEAKKLRLLNKQDIYSTKKQFKEAFAGFMQPR